MSSKEPENYYKQNATLLPDFSSYGYQAVQELGHNNAGNGRVARTDEGHRTGLLNEQGQDCYAFLDKTFQKYLCAQEINYQSDNEGDFDIVLNHIADHLHDPHWREVLLLLIAQQKPKKAARAIRAILDHHSNDKQWLHRDLFFASSCLAENPQYLNVEDNSLSTEIIERLAKLGMSLSPQVSDEIRQQAFQILDSLQKTDFKAQALRILKDRANN